MNLFKLFTSLAFIVSSASLMANNEIPFSSEIIDASSKEYVVEFASLKIFENSKVELSSNSYSNALENLALATYNYSDDSFAIQSYENIHYVKVFKENGELDFQIPINNAQLRFSIGEFEKGNFEVQIQFKKDEEFVTTYMKVK